MTEEDANWEPDDRGAGDVTDSCRKAAQSSVWWSRGEPSSTFGGSGLMATLDRTRTSFHTGFKGIDVVRFILMRLCMSIVAASVSSGIAIARLVGSAADAFRDSKNMTTIISDMLGAPSSPLRRLGESSDALRFVLTVPEEGSADWETMEQSCDRIVADLCPTDATFMWSGEPESCTDIPFFTLACGNWLQLGCVEFHENCPPFGLRREPVLARDLLSLELCKARLPNRYRVDCFLHHIHKRQVLTYHSISPI